MKNMKGIMMMMSVLAIALLTGCGSGDVVSKVDVTGNAVKGPFKTGATVTATKLNADGSATDTSATTTTSDDTGAYDLPVQWSGLTEVAITGQYLDETTGDFKDGSVSAIVVLPATSSAGTSAVTANPNLASTMSAKVAKKALAADPTADPATTVQNSDAAVSSALGLPAGSDLASLNVLESGAANEQLLIVSATMQDAVNKSAAAGGSASIDDFVANLATDVQEGKPVGSNAGATATITSSAASIDIAAIVTNIATVATVDQTALTTSLNTAQTAVTTNIQTTLKGLAMANNTFTFGASTFSIDNYGAATAPAGTPAANTTFAFTLVDATTAAATYNTTFTLDIAAAAANDQRQITASVPVTIVTDGAGNVSATVDAGAVFTYKALDAGGLSVTGTTATNTVANVIQASASNVSVDFNALLAIIKAKLGTNSAAFTVLNTTGDYTFKFSITNVDIGTSNGTAIGQLFPLTGTGRGVSGTVTIL